MTKSLSTFLENLIFVSVLYFNHGTLGSGDPWRRKNSVFEIRTEVQFFQIFCKFEALK